MSLIIFNPTVPSYPNPSLYPQTLTSLSGSSGGYDFLSWSTIPPTSTVQYTPYSVATSSVNGVLLNAEPDYAFYLNQSDVGGVATVLQFTPTGSFAALTGTVVTEEVLVGSYAYWNNAITLLGQMLSHLDQSNSTLVNAFNQIDFAFANLLQGAKPFDMESQIAQAFASVNDPTFSLNAHQLESIASNWDTPVYLLNTGSGWMVNTGQPPEPFGISVLSVNGAAATWATKGAQGGVNLSGYTEYQTYDMQTNQGTTHVVAPLTSGSVEIASQGSGGTIYSPSQINNIYQSVLQRPASNTEQNAWYNAELAGQVTGTHLLNSIETSAEAMQFVYPVIRLYQAAFDRVPDQLGLTGWVNVFKSGVVTEAQMAQGFVNSTEFISHYGSNQVSTGFVGSLYHDVLGRQGSANEVSAWVNSGQSAAKILVGFSDSAEFINDSRAAIIGFLDAAAKGTETYHGPLL
jgi:Domain of unknown function (DUF4214)